jgi:hypothetical protein
MGIFNGCSTFVKPNVRIYKLMFITNVFVALTIKIKLVFYVLFEVYDFNFNFNNLKIFPPMIIILF